MGRGCNSDLDVSKFLESSLRIRFTQDCRSFIHSFNETPFGRYCDQKLCTEKEFKEKKT